MPTSAPYLPPELLGRIAEGDETAFAQLYQQYAARLHHFAFKLTDSATNAEEIVQETFLTLWLHREELETFEHLNAWIYKVTARHCLQWMRRQKSEQQRIDRLTSTDTVVTIATPADVVHWQELQQSVQAALSKLPDVRQQVYRINREEGLKPSAIAVRLQLPVGTVKNHLHLAVKAIREQLNKEGYHYTVLITLSIWSLQNFLPLFS